MICRVAVLMALLGSVAVLFKWSRTADPRFYHFVQSPFGQTLAKVFNWYSTGIRPVPVHKPVSEMTPRELQIRKQLQQSVDAATPAHRTPPEITYRDVRFQMELPEMQLYKRYPYTILTDESYSHVEQAVRLLQRLYQDVQHHFEPLIKQTPEMSNLQLLFFSDETAYLAFQQEYAPDMAGALGFYCPQLNRLIVFNEKQSMQMRELYRRLDQHVDAAKEQHPRKEFHVHADAWRDRLQRSMEYDAEKRTFTTLRHEGAHQLFHAFNIHSDIRLENEWLVEGLATYCETDRIGQKEHYRIKLLQNALRHNDLMPLRDLMDFRHARGFLALGDARRIDLVYSQSWALVAMLLNSPWRNGFFDYINFAGDPAHISELTSRSRLDLLCRFTGTTPRMLEQQLKQYIEKL
jgi:hypothetical protein